MFSSRSSPSAPSPLSIPVSFFPAFVRPARWVWRNLEFRRRHGSRLRQWLGRRLGYRRIRQARRLHVGCGRERLAGWCNIDRLPLDTVDICLDVTRSFPFSGVSHIFAEHFLEHLEVDRAVDFLSACHRSLEDGGWIRLSTPNLDWVWTHLYDRGPAPAGEREREAVHLNRAFYGWRHRFLWNRELLERALSATGFEAIRWCAYGESEHPELRGLERHERNQDTPDLPHVLIVEARKARSRPEEMKALRQLLEDEFLMCRG